MLLEQVLFSCVVLTQDRPAEQADVALKLFWAFVSELPRLPSPRSSSSSPTIADATAAAAAAAASTQPPAPASRAVLATTAATKGGTKGGSEPISALAESGGGAAAAAAAVPTTTTADAATAAAVPELDIIYESIIIRPQDIYVFRLLLILEYFMCVRLSVCLSAGRRSPVVVTVMGWRALASVCLPCAYIACSLFAV